MRAAILAAGLLAAAPDARALWGDRLELYAEEAVAHDSNVFRISDGRDPATFLGSSSRGDTYHVTTLGLNLDIPISRQRLRAGYAFNESRYDRFKDLDFRGYDGRAVWLWETGDRLSGRLGYTETFRLASLSDFQTRVKNPLRVKQPYFDAVYQLTARWRLQAGLSELRQKNGDPARAAQDVDVTTAEAAILYVSRAGNSIGPGVTIEDGKFPNRQLVAGTPVDNAYTQYRANLLLDWNVTALTRVRARAGLVKRSYDQLGQRDFDDAVFRAEVDWTPTARLSVAALAQRDISAAGDIGDIQTSFVRITGVALRPALRITEKTGAAASLEYSVREYLGDPQLALGLRPERTDRVRSAVLALAYRPARFATLILSLQRESRSSTIEFGDYSVTLIRASARLAF
jgi:exopolysaccharide biosynthesis operon protein EpsL